MRIRFDGYVGLWCQSLVGLWLMPVVSAFTAFMLPIRDGSTMWVVAHVAVLYLSMAGAAIAVILAGRVRCASWALMKEGTISFGRAGRMWSHDMTSLQYRVRATGLGLMVDSPEGSRVIYCGMSGSAAQTIVDTINDATYHKRDAASDASPRYAAVNFSASPLRGYLYAWIHLGLGLTLVFEWLRRPDIVPHWQSVVVSVAATLAWLVMRPASEATLKEGVLSVRCRRRTCTYVEGDVLAVMNYVPGGLLIVSRRGLPTIYTGFRFEEAFALVDAIRRDLI